MTDPCVWTPDVSAYLLGGLPDEEHEALAAHLVDCDACQQEIAELERGAAAMPLAVEHRQPPPELKQRLMATVRAEAEVLRAAGPEADRPAVPQPRRSRFPRFAGPVAVGLALAVLAIVGVQSFTGDDPTSQRTIQANVRLTDGTARVQVSDEGRTGELVLDGVPAPPVGYVYEMWLSRPGEAPVPAGTISKVRTDGTTITKISGDLKNVPSLLVTVEPAPGGRTPTQKPVIEARLS